MSSDPVDELIRVVAETHDDTQPDGLWAHIRHDPDAFRRAVRHVLDRHNLHGICLDAIRTGGAVCTVEVRHGKNIWRDQRIVPGHQIENSNVDKSFMIHHTLNSIVRNYDGCEGEQRPKS